MKTRLFSILAATALALFMAACANSDDIAQVENKQKGNTETTEDLTAFVEEDNAQTTRTTAEYDGSGLNFYWTEGDRLWVKNNAESPTLKQDAQNNIAEKLTASTVSGGVQRADKAKFWFDGTHTNASQPEHHLEVEGCRSTTGVRDHTANTHPCHKCRHYSAGSGNLQHTYHRIHFYNTYKNKNITTSKTYNNVVLTAGKNKSVKADLNIPACKFPEDYYFGRNTQVSSCPNMNEIV